MTQEIYFKDMLGNKTQAGDTVALASRVGNSVEMKIRLVEEVDPNKSVRTVKVTNLSTGRSAYPSTSNMINITKIMKEVQ